MSLNDLVKRKDVIKAIVDAKDSDICQKEQVLFYIDQVPAAKPNNGRWVAEKTHGFFTPGGNPVYHCSECGWIFGSHRLFPDYKFCPGCGANMNSKGDIR